MTRAESGTAPNTVGVENEGEIVMFRCDNCGSGYSARAATWESCPRCYAKEGVEHPLTLEFGWHASGVRAREEAEEDLERAAERVGDAGAAPAAAA